MRKAPFALMAALVSSMAALSAQEIGQAASVQVRKIELVSAGSIAGGPTGVLLLYGDRVTVLAKKGNWAQVKTGKGKTGWLNLSALTPKRIVLESEKGSASTVSGSDVALAGKGFSREIEAQYREDGQIDYGWVDLMENRDPDDPDRSAGRGEFAPSIAELNSFAASGGLEGE